MFSFFRIITIAVKLNSKQNLWSSSLKKNIYAITIINNANNPAHHHKIMGGKTLITLPPYNRIRGNFFASFALMWLMSIQEWFFL